MIWAEKKYFPPPCLFHELNPEPRGSLRAYLKFCGQSKYCQKKKIFHDDRMFLGNTLHNEKPSKSTPKKCHTQKNISDYETKLLFAEQGQVMDISHQYSFQKVRFQAISEGPKSALP